MLLEVVEKDYEVINSSGSQAVITWKIIDICERKPGTEYHEPDTGKGYSLRKVMKSRRLLHKKQSGDIIHIPPCTHYLVVQEYHDGNAALKRCYSVDMLELIQYARIAG